MNYKNELYNKWSFLNKELKNKLKINNRKDRKLLWKTVQEVVNYDNYPFNIFLEYKLLPYQNEITEIFNEKKAIEKIRPHLIKYIYWRLYNPSNGIRFLKTLHLWNKRL